MTGPPPGGGGPSSSTAPFTTAVELDENFSVSGTGANRKEAGVVTLREWYVVNYCSNGHVKGIVDIQSCAPNSFPLLSRYFHFWSELGGGTFYTMLICWLIWSGRAEEGIRLCIMLSLALYVTNVLKDYCGCPRPPSPPVRKGGTVSHAIEYGWPSTHTALACQLCYELGFLYLVAAASTTTASVTLGTRSSSSVQSGYIDLISAASYFDLAVWFVCSAIFVGHIAFSRVFLGLHWVADIVGGLAVFVFIVLCDAAFLARTVSALIRTTEIPGLLVVLLGHWMLVVHPSPRGPCPCFEDSVRFIGVDVGAILGYHMTLESGLSTTLLGTGTLSSATAHSAVASTPPETAAPNPSSPGFFSWHFGAAYVAALVFVLTVRAVVSYLTIRSLARLLPFFAGGVRRIDDGTQSRCNKSRVYFFLCAAVGLLLGKRITRVETPLGSSSAGTAVAPHAHEPSSNMPIVVATAAEDATSTEVAHEHGHGGSTGVYWTLRNHTHWLEDVILAKFVTYMSMGIAVGWIVPLINARWNEKWLEF